LGSKALGGGLSFWLVLGTTAIVAAGLRLYRLEAASFWVDELNTIRVCAGMQAAHRAKVFGYVPTAVGLWVHGSDLATLSAVHPEAWRRQGVTEYTARIGSCVVGIVTIPLLAVMTVGLAGRSAAAVLAILLAVAPWHIYWSQASRFYTLQFLFYSLCFILYLRATTGNRWGRSRMVAAMGFLVLAFLAQPPGLVICLVFAADWLISVVRRERVRLGKFGWTCGALAVALCMAVLAGDVQREPGDWTQFASQHYQSPTKMILGTVFMVNVPVALFAVLAGWRLVRHSGRIGPYLVLGAAVPPLFFAALSTQTYVGLRYAFVSLYAWLALTAIGVDEIYQYARQHVGRLMSLSPLFLVLASMMLMNHGYYTSGRGFHTRWRDAFEYVAARRAPGELVFSDNHPMIGRYYLEDASVERLPPSAEALAAVGRPAWIVVEAEDVIRGAVKPWVGEVSEFKAYFDVRVVQPYSSVRVYYYNPSVVRARPVAAVNGG